MSEELSDGSILPNYLAHNTDDYSDGYNVFKQEYSLRVGRVIGTYYPNNENNISRKFIEYDVEVLHSNGSGSYAFIVYHKCQLASMFGGVADYTRWTLRTENLDENNKLSFGSRVLVACINGDASLAYIIGGIPHFNIQEKIIEDGHYYNNEFNGLFTRINNDGEYKILHKGATDSDGSIIDDSGSGSSIIMNKSGDISIGYSTESDNSTETDTDKPFIKWLKSDNKLNLFAPSDIGSETQAKFLIKTTSGVKINESGSDSQAFLRGTVYRRQQEIMHNTIKPLLTTLSTLIQTAGTSISTAAASHVIPITGPIVGAPSLVAASVALISASQLFTQIQVAIATFEGQSSQYLSTHHNFAESP